MAEVEAPDPVPIPPPIIAADLCLETPRRIIRSRVYYATDTAPDNVQHLSAICDAIKAHWQTAYLALCPTVHRFIRVEGHWYGSGSSGFDANSTTASAGGSISAPELNDDSVSETEDVMPDDTCLIIQKKTALRGRSNQGRLFIGGISEVVQYGGQITGNHEAPAKALAAKLPSDINVNASGFVTVLHSRHWCRRPINIMRPIVNAYVVKGIGSRMDRRNRVMMQRL